MFKTINAAAKSAQVAIQLVSTVITDGAEEYSQWQTDRKEVNKAVNMRKVEMLMDKIQEVEALKLADDTTKQAVLAKLKAALAKELAE